MSDTPNISIGSVSGGQNNIGKTEIAGDQIQNVSPQTVDLGEVVNTIEQGLPDEVAAATIPEIQAIAQLPTETQRTPEVQKRILAVCDAVRPYAGVVWKNLAIFSAAALKTLAMKNPIIAGVIEVCEANSGSPSV